jgi:hypothetical protein
VLRDVGPAPARARSDVDAELREAVNLTIGWLDELANASPSVRLPPGLGTAAKRYADRLRSALSLDRIRERLQGEGE